MILKKKNRAAERPFQLSVGYDAVANQVQVSAPEGYRIALNGADFPQIVGKNLEVYRPLAEQEVCLSFRVTDPEGIETVTGDYPVRIPGIYRNKAAHPKPSVIPELAQWHSADSGWFIPSETTAIVVSPSAWEALSAAAEELQQDFQEMIGWEPSVRCGDSAGDGDFYLTLSDADAYLGREGYRMEIGTGVLVSASHPCGVYWATRTILQMLRLSGSKARMPRGEIRDYPKYPVRGFMLDVGRRPFSMETLRAVAKNMAWYKMNDLQLHLNDNYIWLEDYNVRGEETDSFEAYEAMRLESGLRNSGGETAEAKDYSYTKVAFKAFLEEVSARYQVHIVPEIDVPAHALSFTRVFPQYMLAGKLAPQPKNRPLTDHLDVGRPETVAFIKRIFDDYTGGEQPVFGPETTVHIGADEFITDFGAYRRFVNELVPHLKKTNPVRLWGSLTWIRDDPATPILPEAVEGVQMNLWSANWADGMEMYEMGYQLINTIDHLLYMVPNGRGNKGSYADRLNKRMVFQKFDPRRVRLKNGKYEALPAGDPQMLGAAYALWNDNIDKKANGLTETDLFLRFFDALPLLAEKTWANGREKGGWKAIDRIARETAFAPRTNPLHREKTTNGLFAEYRFDSVRPQTDLSGNGRDLPEVVNAALVAGLLLQGGESYLQTPLSCLEMGSFLECGVTFEELRPGQILFECDAPYGAFDIRITANGRLGFTREGYVYEFPCVLPAKQRLVLRIQTGLQETTLSVNGNPPKPAVGKFVHNGTVRCEGLQNASFHLPVQRIGSKTNAALAKIDFLRAGKVEGRLSKLEKLFL